MRKTVAATTVLLSALLLGACDDVGGGGAGSARPGTDALYGFTLVHEGTDGSIEVGSIHCDGNGRYVAGGAPGEAEQARRWIDAAIDKARQEISEIDKTLDRCKGPNRKTQRDYDAAAGCERDKFYAANWAYDSAAHELQQARDEVGLLRAWKARLEKDIRVYEQYLRETEASSAVLESIGRAVLPDTGSEFKRPDRETMIKGLKSEIAHFKKELAEVSAKLPAAEADFRDKHHKVAETEKPYRELAASCARADKTAKTDPCISVNDDELNARKTALRSQADNDQNRKNRLDKCIADRNQQAAKSSRTTVDPSAVIGIIGGMRTAPRSKPTPSSPPPPSGHKD